MESDKLYRVQRQDLPRLERLLNRCFAHDPLYETLIPDPEVRTKLLPELFHCDLNEAWETCEIFADSAALNSVLVVSDEAEPYDLLHYYMSEVHASLQTDNYLIREDPSLKTLHNFLAGKEYLDSSWTDELHQDQRLHIIYLAVDPGAQHHGLAALLLDEVIAYARRHGLMISLETHNQKNLDFYTKFGFRIYRVMEKHFDLKQYCLLWESAEAQIARP